MSRISTLIISFLFTAPCFGQCDISESKIQWQTDGVVNSTAKIGNKLFIGGSFSTVSVACGNMLSFDPLNTRPVADLRFPTVTGTIKHIVGDGAGGWIIAGNLTKVGTQNVSHLAHVKSDFTLDLSWIPVINGAITALATGDGKLYIAGNFTTVNGNARQRLASFNLNGLTLTPFVFNNSWTINSLAVQNGVLYVAGQFSHFVNPQNWNNLACIEINTAILKPPFASINGIINSCVVKGNTILIGGTFTQVFGQARNQVALMDTFGTLRSFNPNPNGVVKALFVGDNSVFVAGAFTVIGGLPRNRIAAFNLAGTSILSWNPVMNNEVNSLFSYGSKIYAGGAFTAVGSSARNNIAAFDTATLLLDSFNISTVNSPVVYCNIVNNRLIASGSFTGCNINSRVNLAGFNVDENTVLPWNPDPQNASSTNTISSVNVTGSSLLIGGAFSIIAGQARKHFAMFDTSGNLLSFNADITGNRINSIVTGGNKIFIGGEFTAAAGQPASNICAFDASSFTRILNGLTSDGALRTLAYSSGLLYTGGQFTSFNSQTRNYAACVDVSTGVLTNWNPSPNYFVVAIHPVKDKVYLGGFFTQVSSTARKYVALVDTINGSLNAWNPDPNAMVQAIYAFKGKLFVGGAFTQMNATSRTYLATYDEASHTLLPIQVTPDNWITNINAYDSSLFICGGYQNIDGKPRRSFSAYNMFELIPTSTPIVLNAVPVTTSSIRLNWNKGNGNGYIVLARRNNPVNANPINNTTYSSNAVFGSGSAINSDNFVVYKGTDTNVTVTGLNISNTYSFAVFCYNAYGSCIIHSYTPAVVNNVALPVKWVNFTGNFNGAYTELKWTTSFELNNQGFEVQRNKSNTSEGWDNIAFTEGAGNKQTVSNYLYHDYGSPFLLDQGGVLYYRLKQVDYNNEGTYSKVISVSSLRDEQHGFSVYPVPADQFIGILGAGQAVAYRIINAAGNEVANELFKQKKIAVGALEAGFYVIDITDVAGNHTYAKFIKR